MSQKLFYVDTRAASNFRKIRIFHGGVEVDLADPDVKTPNIPLSANVDFWLVVSQTPVSSGYTGKINASSGKVWIPVTDSNNVNFDLDSKITLLTNPGSVDLSSKVFDIKNIWGTSEDSPSENDWVALAFDKSNKRISKLNGALPKHIRVDVELNPFGGSDTQLDGAAAYAGLIKSSMYSEEWLFSNNLQADDTQGVDAA